MNRIMNFLNSILCCFLGHTWKYIGTTQRKKHYICIECGKTSYARVIIEGLEEEEYENIS